jgi:hypothetical protein
MKTVYVRGDWLFSGNGVRSEGTGLQANCDNVVL